MRRKQWFSEAIYKEFGMGEGVIWKSLGEVLAYINRSWYWVLDTTQKMIENAVDDINRD